MFTIEEKALISGSDSEVEEFVNCDHCMVIDWRSTVDEVLQDAPRWLPPESLRHSWLDSKQTQLRLTFANREEIVTLRQKTNDNALVIYRIARLLRPDYELFVFTCTTPGTDTAAFLIRPAAWWTAYRTQFPDRFEQHFALMEKYPKHW
jgi:hypothetical protein